MGIVCMGEKQEDWPGWDIRCVFGRHALKRDAMNSADPASNWKGQACILEENLRELNAEPLISFPF